MYLFVLEKNQAQACLEKAIKSIIVSSAVSQTLTLNIRERCLELQ